MADSYEPHLERADSVRSLSINNNLRQNIIAAHNVSTNDSENDPGFTDANDDEVRELTSGKEKQGSAFVSTSNSKPGLLPDAQATALNKTLNLGLPQHGTFSDAHSGQKLSPSSDIKSSISTQEHLPSADVFHKPIAGANISSFEPISTSTTQYPPPFLNQEAAKSIGKEQI